MFPRWQFLRACQRKSSSVLGRIQESKHVCKKAAAMRRIFLLLLLGIAVFPLAGQYHDASAQAAPAHRTVHVTGLKQAGANGVRIDITLDIPPGADTDAIVRDALARRGAQPVTGSDPTAQFVLPTLRWPQFVGPGQSPPVLQYYNTTG